jgi:large subunit ribosomal protein L23
MTQLFDVLRRPIVTEKSNYLGTSLHQYVFEVTDTATRKEVKDAVENAFKVTVIRVNIINVPEKVTRRARSHRLGVRAPSYKKAIITLAPDNRIPIFEGVE